MRPEMEVEGKEKQGGGDAAGRYYGSLLWNVQVCPVQGMWRSEIHELTTLVLDGD